VGEEAAEGFERPEEDIALGGRVIEFFGGPHKGTLNLCWVK